MDKLCINRFFNFLNTRNIINPYNQASVRSKAVIILFLNCCLLLLLLLLWDSVIVLCFVVCYFVSILVLQSS